MHFDLVLAPWAPWLLLVLWASSAVMAVWNWGSWWAGCKEEWRAVWWMVRSRKESAWQFPWLTAYKLGLLLGVPLLFLMEGPPLWAPWLVVGLLVWDGVYHGEQWWKQRGTMGLWGYWWGIVLLLLEGTVLWFYPYWEVVLYIVLLRPVVYGALRGIGIAVGGIREWWLLWSLARRRTERRHVLVIAVAGSSGKSSLLHCLEQLLSPKFRLYAAYGSDQGVAQQIQGLLSAWKSGEKYEVILWEMGMASTGSMQRLYTALDPMMMVVTGVNERHSAWWGSPHEQWKRLAAVWKHMEGASKLVVLPGAVHYPPEVVGALTAPVWWYAEGAPEADIYVEQVKEDMVSYILHQERLVVAHTLTPWTVPVVLPALAVARKLGVALPMLATGLESYQPLAGRGTMMHTAHGARVWYDGVAPSPTTMSTLPRVAAGCAGVRRVVIVGTLVGLAQEYGALYEYWGRLLGGQVEDVVFVGALGWEAFRTGVVESGGYATHVHHVLTEQALYQWCRSHVFAEDVVLWCRETVGVPELVIKKALGG